MANKTIIRLTESDIHQMVLEGVKKALKEIRKTNYWAKKTKCPKCGKEGNPFFGGLCPDCAKGNNYANDKIRTESVNEESLNELDPRTYASAANIARQRGDSRAGAFQQAAAHSFNTSNVAHMKDQQGGYTDPNYSKRELENYWQSMKPNGELVQYGPNSRTNYNFQGSNENPYGTNTRYNKGMVAGTTNRTSWNDANGVQKYDEPQAFAQGRQIAQQMQNGTGTYQKGKGWQ